MKLIGFFLELTLDFLNLLLEDGTCNILVVQFCFTYHCIYM